MGLLDTILSAIDSKKRTLKRGVMDMLDNPQQWAGMQANRIQEDRYGGAENAQAMKQYLSKQPYDQKALTAANDALRNAAVNESLGAIFVGKGAKTWDKMKEADAMARLAKGEDAATVWKETGVGVAPWDNAARTEISDHTAKLTPISELVKQRNAGLIAEKNRIVANVKEAGRKPTDLEKFQVNNLNELISTSAYRGTVGDALDHPELFAAHPEMKGQDFRWREMPVSDKGSWDQNSGMMLNQGLFGNDAKSIVLHEGQHASQDYSKLARGGSPEMFNPKEAEKARDILSWRNEVEGWIKKNWPNAKIDTEVLQNADQRLRDEYNALGAYDVVPPAELRDTALSYTFKVGSKQRDDMAQMVKEYGLDQRVSAPSSTDMYQRLAGEAEARLAQYRMNLTPEARSALYPYDPTYFKQATGVDIDKLITRGLLDQ